MGKKVQIEAPAKVNLFLKVGRRRPDGYHEVLTLLQTVELCDLVEVELSRGGIRLEVEGDLPCGEDNLCLRAARVFELRTGIKVEALIRLHKRIPVGAGLGGGSADAAAVLLGLNLLLGEPMGEDELQRAGMELGSDVPFFFLGGTALAEGRGELVRRVPAARRFRVLLLNPGFSLSTAEVYREYDKLCPSPPPLGEIPGGLMRGLQRGIAEEVGMYLQNDLINAAFRLAPQLEPILKRLTREGPGGMSGSGPTLFLISMEEEALLRVGIRMALPWCMVAEFRDRGVAPV